MEEFEDKSPVTTRFSTSGILLIFLHTLAILGRYHVETDNYPSLRRIVFIQVILLPFFSQQVGMLFRVCNVNGIAKIHAIIEDW